MKAEGDGWTSLSQARRAVQDVIYYLQRVNHGAWIFNELVNTIFSGFQLKLITIKRTCKLVRTFILRSPSAISIILGGLMMMEIALGDLMMKVLTDLQVCFIVMGSRVFSPVQSISPPNRSLRTATIPPQRPRNVDSRRCLWNVIRWYFKCGHSAVLLFYPF